MRIEAYNQVASLYKSQKTEKPQGNRTVGGKDEVQISQAGRDFQVAKQAVEQSSDIRNDKVAQLKAKIDSGQYNVSPDDFAAKLLENFKAYQ